MACNQRLARIVEEEYLDCHRPLDGSIIVESIENVTGYCECLSGRNLCRNRIDCNRAVDLNCEINEGLISDPTTCVCDGQIVSQVIWGMNPQIVEARSGIGEQSRIKSGNSIDIGHRAVDYCLIRAAPVEPKVDIGIRN